MSSQHHFVVVCQDGQWFIDHGTTEARFPEGPVWDEGIEDWRYAHSSEGENKMLIDLESRLR